MKRYKIADLLVDMECRYPTMQKQSIPYETVMTDTPADISVCVSEASIDSGVLKYKGLTRNDIEYVYAGSQFYRALLSFNGMMLHASGVVKNGYAYLFSADSGTGKSTHTSLWLKAFGRDAFIINDDKPALRIINGEIFVYGTPFSGKTDINVNTRAKLGGICFLQRSENNWIKPIKPGDAVLPSLRQTMNRLNADNMPVMLALLDKILSGTPLWKMGCNMSTDAAILAYETMRKVAGSDA